MPAPRRSSLAPLALAPLIALSLAPEAGCGGGDDAEAGEPSSGLSLGGQSGQSGQGNQAGSGQAGKAGQAGQAGQGLAGQGGKAASGGSGSGGFPSGTSGSSGQAGQAGQAAQAGQAGMTGQAGQAGMTGQAGQAGAGQGGQGAAGSAPSGGSGGGSSSSCPCLYDVDNFCLYPAATAGCPMLLPGGYCNPGGGKEPDWNQGYYAFHDACQPGCGDGACKGPETCASCKGDCGSCPPGPVCGDGACQPPETAESCAKDCAGPVADEPHRLLGLHFWDQAATSKLAPGTFYDVEAFSSDTPPATIVAWLTEREQAGARVIVRIDYKWGYSVPKTEGERGEYSQRLVAIAQAMAAAKRLSHHFVVGNETNLPGEGGASADEAAAAYVAARSALAQAGPWAIAPVVMPAPPSTAAEYGGGDGSYLKAEMQAIKAMGVFPDAIALHAYENADGGGTANLFMATVAYESKALLDAGVAGAPLFITEFNMAMNGPGGDQAGAAFITNAMKRLDAWNHGGEGNPAPDQLVFASACHFVWHDDGNWGPMAIQSYPAALSAFQAAWSAGYASAWPK